MKEPSQPCQEETNPKDVIIKAQQRMETDRQEEGPLITQGMLMRVAICVCTITNHRQEGDRRVSERGRAAISKALCGEPGFIPSLTPDQPGKYSSLTSTSCDDSSFLHGLLLCCQTIPSFFEKVQIVVIIVLG